MINDTVAQRAVCEDATKLLAEKYGFDFKEAMELVLRS